MGLAIGPLVPLLDAVAVPLPALLGRRSRFLVGSWTGAPRMIKSLAQDSSSLGPRRSIAAIVPSPPHRATRRLPRCSCVVQRDIAALSGSGAAVGGSEAIDPQKIVVTVGAWAGSFTLVAGDGYG